MRRSAPVSQTSIPASPRRAAFAPQPIAGVEYWSLAGVVVLRLAATATELFFKSLSRIQAWNRQPSAVGVGAAA